MEKPLLFRNHSEESQQAEKLLEKNNIDFVSIFSDTDKTLPFVDHEISAYPYIGIGEIRIFIDTVSSN